MSLIRIFDEYNIIQKRFHINLIICKNEVTKFYELTHHLKRNNQIEMNYIAFIQNLNYIPTNHI